MQRLLAERSHRGRKIPDLLIAAAAEQLDVGALHYDAESRSSPRSLTNAASGSCPPAASTDQRCRRSRNRPRDGSSRLWYAHNDDPHEEPTVIHAMPLRAKFQYYLR